tara:strand:- start:109 stop:525 length:417 start_codon:yes stop_codon:yes gene_type:complete
MKNLSSKGSCLCGGIKFFTKGLHRHISNCHCSQCMKTHGNFAAYTMIKNKNIKFLSKKTLKWFKSSKKAKRGFCNKCGASAFFKSDNSDNIHISAGLFNKSLKLKTVRNIFTKNKLKYYKLDKEIPKYNRYSYLDKSG